MINKVRLENWKSHRETELEFSEGVNALIGTMGSGKSSVLEAVVFGLFGTTPSLNSRDIQLNDLIRRNPSEAEEASVEIEFSIDGEDYSVKRELKRDKGTERSELRKNREVVEAPSTREVTEQVERILSLDFKSFARAIYSEQNNLDLFLKMRPGNRKERVDELLKIDRFENARKTVVKVENSLKKELERKQEELGELEEEFDSEELEELEEDIEKRREDLEDTDEDIEELNKEIEERQELKEELEEKKKFYRKLEKRITKLETRKESLEEEFGKVEERLEKYEKPEEKLEEHLEEKKELEEKEKEISGLEKDLKYLKKEKKKLEEDIEKLEEKAENFKEIGEIEEEIERLEKIVEKIKQKGNAKHTERTNLEESLEELQNSDGECPTCGKELSEEHRGEVVGEREEEIKKLKEQENRLRKKFEEKNERKEKLESRRDELLEYRSAEEKLELKQEKLEEKVEEIKETEERLREMRQDFSEDRINKLEEDIADLKKVEKRDELEERLENVEEKLEEVEAELEELEFDEDELEELKKETSRLKEERSVKTKELESEKELIQEKEKRLEQMQKQDERKKNLEDDIERLDHALDFSHEYREGLVKTQVSLREMFVKRLNTKMEDIWNQLYPYDDYYSIRLNAEKDYLLELLDSENQWVSAEAEVSGGERHLAALVMRLSLTFTLSPELEVLMLDEPTHNMDSSAVEELAETLRENSNDLIKQLLIVTHDSSLESAATGDLYRFEKKNTEEGLTETEKVE